MTAWRRRRYLKFKERYTQQFQERVEHAPSASNEDVDQMVGLLHRLMDLVFERNPGIVSDWEMFQEIVDREIYRIAASGADAERKEVLVRAVENLNNRQVARVFMKGVNRFVLLVVVLVVLLVLFLRMGLFFPTRS